MSVDLLARISSAPIRYIVLTQGHVDHVGGIDRFKQEHPEALVVAQRNIADCQADDERIQAFRYRRNVRFFPEFLTPLASGDEAGATSGQDPTQSVARPDLTFDDEHRFELGGVRFELLSVPGGETIDSLLIWLPDRGILFSGNALGPLFPHLPNLYTIRGDRLRFALPYIETVQKMLDIAPEMLVTGHFDPIAGADLIRTELVRLRDAVRFVHDRDRGAGRHRSVGGKGGRAPLGRPRARGDLEHEDQQGMLVELLEMKDQEEAK